PRRTGRVTTIQPAAPIRTRRREHATRGDETRLWNLQRHPTLVIPGAGWGSGRLEAGWGPRSPEGREGQRPRSGQPRPAPPRAHSIGDPDRRGQQTEQQREQAAVRAWALCRRPPRRGPSVARG